MSHELSRREFALSAVAAGTAMAAQTSAGVLGANERLQVGVIGVGNRGRELQDALKAIPEAKITALCDVYDPFLQAAKDDLGGNVATYKDYRKLIESKDVDAVVIGTPDHWHALQFVDACNAGKDVYVEKPLSLTVKEGRIMCDVAKKTGRVTQVGTHRRSSKMYAKAAELVRSGHIGHVSVANCYHLQNETPMGMGKPADSAPPPGLDWDLWLGPAPKVPYNRNRCLYRFRWFYEYSGGQLTNFGTHYLDIIQWALGQNAPKAVMAMGGKYAVQDNREIPDTMQVVWQYDGCIVTFSQYNANSAAGNPPHAETEFRGTLATLYTGYRGCTIEPQRVRYREIPFKDPRDRKGSNGQYGALKPSGVEKSEIKGGATNVDHVRNWVECVKARKECSAPVEVGHRSTSATLIGNIALKRGKVLEWDAQAERFTNDDKANEMLFYQYRKPWKLA
ncbi:MAG: Gfo/Idh/MocA family oxidoreductase [Phycisphaerae bacterium]|nr:Gfo/Idh/MocA family oxidoreductase [Phycisphaerae bacterium]